MNSGKNSFDKRLESAGAGRAQSLVTLLSPLHQSRKLYCGKAFYTANLINSPLLSPAKCWRNHRARKRKSCRCSVIIVSAAELTDKKVQIGQTPRSPGLRPRAPRAVRRNPGKHKKLTAALTPRGKRRRAGRTEKPNTGRTDHSNPTGLINRSVSGPVNLVRWYPAE